MGIELFDPGPEWIDIRDRIIEDNWPEIDEDLLDMLSVTWVALGERLVGLRDGSQDAMSGVLGAYGSDTGDAIAIEWGILGYGAKGIQGLVDEVDEIRIALGQAKGAITLAKYNILNELLDCLNSIYGILVQYEGEISGVNTFLSGGLPREAELIVENGQVEVERLYIELVAELATIQITPFEPAAGSELAGQLQAFGGLTPSEEAVQAWEEVAEQEELDPGGLPSEVQDGLEAVTAATDIYALVGSGTGATVAKIGGPVVAGGAAYVDEALADYGYSERYQHERALFRGGTVWTWSHIPLVGGVIAEEILRMSGFYDHPVPEPDPPPIEELDGLDLKIRAFEMATGQAEPAKPNPDL